MPESHPAASVGPRAELAADVRVGPWCSIEGRVALGPGTRLMERVTLRGPLRAGAGNVVYPNASLGFPAQHRRFDPATEGAGVSLGDQNVLREGVTIHRATGEAPTRLGDRNYLMVNAHLGHDAVVGNDCTLANNTALAGHVTLADGVTLGGGAAIHQFARVGRLAIISGLAGLSQD